MRKPPKLTIEDLIRREGRVPGGMPPRRPKLIHIHIPYAPFDWLKTAMRPDKTHRKPVRLLNRPNPMLKNASWRKA